MSKLQQLREFCQANVFFYTLSNSDLFDGKAVGVISPSMVNSLIKVIETTSDNFPKGDYYPVRDGCNIWKTQTQGHFITTYWGMFYIQDVTAGCYVVENIKVVWPDTVKKMMEENVIPYHSGVYKTVCEKQDSWVNDKLTSLDLKKKKQREQEEEKGRIEQEMYTLLGEELASRVLSIDLFYDYSDDARVYRQGAEIEQKLCEDLRTNGYDPKAILDKIRRSKTVSY